MKKGFFKFQIIQLIIVAIVSVIILVKMMYPQIKQMNITDNNTAYERENNNER